MTPSALSKKLAAIYRRAGYEVAERGKQSDGHGGHVWVVAIRDLNRNVGYQLVGSIRIHPGSHISILGAPDYEFDDERVTERRRQELERVLKP